MVAIFTIAQRSLKKIQDFNGASILIVSFKN